MGPEEQNFTVLLMAAHFPMKQVKGPARLSSVFAVPVESIREEEATDPPIHTKNTGYSTTIVCSCSSQELMFVIIRKIVMASAHGTICQR